MLPTTSGYEMWYIGASAHIEDQWVGYATSTDGISWIKWPSNPILDTSPPWGYAYGPGTLLKFDDFYHYWFTSWPQGSGVNELGRIGYATSSIAVSVATREDDSGIPSEYLLQQNYPNPFNPATNIRYELTKSSAVVLQVFDVLGREVRMLVNEVKPAGLHEVKWDGLNEAGLPVSSGLYLYRIENQNQIVMKKMVLMR